MRWRLQLSCCLSSILGLVFETIRRWHLLYLKTLGRHNYKRIEGPDGYNLGETLGVSTSYNLSILPSLSVSTW